MLHSTALYLHYLVYKVLCVCVLNYILGKPKCRFYIILSLNITCLLNCADSNTPISFLNFVEENRYNPVKFVMDKKLLIALFALRVQLPEKPSFTTVFSCVLVMSSQV